MDHLRFPLDKVETLEKNVQARNERMDNDHDYEKKFEKSESKGRFFECYLNNLSKKKRSHKRSARHTQEKVLHATCRSPKESKTTITGTKYDSFPYKYHSCNVIGKCAWFVSFIKVPHI
ncbi:hypothetical protein TNCV_1439721 [Trichonephila clavipes]|nr:hypothetical protein TNCV_1439721 [Trichonephila clavipes]